MDIETFMMKQVQLNSHLDKEPNENQLVAAITAELGEFMNSVKFGKYGWAWWIRKEKKGSSRDEVLGEYIDILHFLLVGYEMFNKGALEYHQVMMDEFVDTDPMTETEALFDYPFLILKHSRERRYHLAILAWVALGKVYGFTKKEIEFGFESSIKKNLGRWNG